MTKDELIRKATTVNGSLDKHIRLVDLLEFIESKNGCDGCEHYNQKQGLRFCSLGWECKRGAFDKFKQKGTK